MRLSRLFLAYIAVVIFFSPVMFSDILDRVSIIIDDKIILESEIDQLVVHAKEAFPKLAESELREKMIEQIINEEILYAVAKKDSNVVIPEKQIDDAVEGRVEQIKQQVGGEKVLKERYNLTLKDLKNKYYEDVKRSLFVNSYKRHILRNVDVTRKEVEEFYNNKKDSLPDIESSILLGQIVFKYSSRKYEDQAVIDSLISIREKVIQGKLSFEEAAKIYSQDPSTAENNGNLGLTNRGDLVLDYEKTAYSLNAGDISQPVKTIFGYHLIKVLNKLGDKIETQHILIKPNLTKEVKQVTEIQAQSVLDSLKEQLFTFEEAVQKYSDDLLTKKNNGLMNRIPLSDMAVAEKNRFLGKDLGFISELVKRDDGVYIYKIVDMTLQHKVTMETDFEKLKEWTLAVAREKVLLKRIKNLKNRVYIEIK